MRTRQRQARDAARFFIEDLVEDVRERLDFLRLEPRRAFVLGDWTGELASILARSGAQVVRGDPAPVDGEIEIDEELPLPVSQQDLVVSLGVLDTVNDLPGALIHLRNAVAPGGLVIASFAGAGSLGALRQVMLAADGERPAARIHPLVDVRAGAQLIQRAGWADPVVDSHHLSVSYASLPRLVADLRDQDLGNVLATRSPALGKEALRRAGQAFADLAGENGRMIETFEIVTLSGRRPK